MLKVTGMATAETEKKASQVLIKSHYEQATRYLDKAVTCDENGDKGQANTHYSKALRSIEVGLAIKRSQSEHEAETSRKIHEKLTKLKSQVEERLKVLNSNAAPKDKRPPRPPPPVTLNSQKSQHNYIPSTVNNAQPSVQSWEDVQELLSIENGVTMFFVSEQGHVTTLYQPQTLRAMQLLNQTSDNGNPSAFLHCGSWIFPLVPGKSPVLKTEDKTFMIPDINLDSGQTSTTQQQLAQGKFATVGLVFSPDISDDQIKRFERILKCYADYRHYTPPANIAENDQTAVVPLAPATLEPEVNSETSLVPAGDATVASKNEQPNATWGSKVSKGIEVGAVLISWGLSKGAELGGNLINQGSEKLRGKIKPNEEAAKIDPKIEDNVRQIKTATGVACQVSSAIVSAVSALTYELGKQLGPVIIEQGTKLLPKSAKQDGSKGKGHIEEVVKVAVSGVQGNRQVTYFITVSPRRRKIIDIGGIAVVHEGLTKAWKIFYTSLSQATVTTIDHKYGEQAGRITNDAFGAVGNAVEVYQNVNHIGYKAIAKKALKETGKECIYDANKKYIENEK